MATEDDQEYEKKLLSKFPSLDNKFPRTIHIPLSGTVRSIKTREELISMAPRNESSGPYTVGDLIWVRMSGYPHWPAMISRDPTDGRFCKSSVSQGSTYHVQYFAEATRGWTQPKMFWPFEGPNLFINGRPALPKINKRKKLYEEAISEALHALRMEPQMRIKRLTYNYILTDLKAPPSSAKKAPPSIKKRRVPSKVKSSNDESIYDFDETIDDFEPEEDKLLEPLKWSRPREVTPPREATPSRDENDESEKDDLPATPIMARDDSSDELGEESRAEDAKEQHPDPADDKEQEAVSKLNSSDETGQLAVIEEVEEERKPDQVQPGRRTRSMPRREMSPINDNSASRPNKRMRGSSVVKRPPPPPTDVMTSSEDASSTSDLEAPDVRLDKLCNVCHEENGPFYFCSGTCLRTMHAECGGSESTNNNSENFICQECRTGKHPCFVCKSTDGDTYKCCHKNCGKYYHLACLDPNSYPASIRSGQTFTCPMHHCLTCYTDLPYPRDINCIKPSKRQLLKCLSCPTAFHNDDACTAPGTVLLAGSYVMCPAHRIPNSKNDRNVNVSWCFSCNEGGELICCESCPAAFHAECIDNPPSADEQYFCYDCQNRKQLHYGDILWIKSGSYRWWPAKIIHPNAVPDNIMNLSHTRGDFPVYFFGTHDYNWSHRGRVFAYVEEDGQVKLKASSSDKKPAYKLAVQEARTEYLQRMKHEEERREKLKNMEKPRFKLIKQNRPINDVVQSTPDDIKLSSKQRCDCRPDGEILCGTEECINVAMMIECDPSTCPVKEKCKNQRFRKRQYPVVVPFRTDSVGWGLRTTQDIKMGEFVIEYVGELIDEATCNRRMEEKMDRGDTTFYFLTIDKERIIDAGPMANHARFMNHSCQPNCETQKWVVNGQTKVGLFAISDIPAGTELTFNYNLDCRGNEKMKCRCRSENCSGYIGLPVKNARKGS